MSAVRRTRGLTLTLKMILLVCAAGAFSAVCTALAQTFLVLPSFTALEAREASQDGLRVRAGFDAEADELVRAAREGAAVWKPETTSRTGDQLLEALSLDLVSIFDSGGRLLWARALDPLSRQVAPGAELLQPTFSSGHPLIWAANTPPPYATAVRRGMAITGMGVAVIASIPLLADRAKGPVVGTLIVGRLVSGPLVDRLRVRAQVEFSTRTLTPADPLPAGAEPWIQLKGPVLEASSLLRDFAGSPIARLIIERPTEIIGRGRATVLWSFAPLFGALAIVMVAFSYLMNVTILSPLDRLSRMVTSIRTTGTFVARLGLRRRDEIGTLAEDFDSMLDQLSEKSALLQQLATTDALTGIMNRRAIMDALTRESSRAGRYGLPLSVLVTDIDHFKDVNDTYGHAAGDDVLVGVARHLAATVRDSDFAGRFGGEEFLIVLPHQDAHGAVLAAERIRIGIEETVMAAKTLKVTVSIGVGTLSEGKAEEMLARADKALYEAKRNGRNRTVAG